MLYMYISLAMMNGAFMSDNLGVMLFLGRTVVHPLWDTAYQ